MRAIGRASVVLLSSHFERYFYAVNEEATNFVNACSIAGKDLPESLRLVHSRQAIDILKEVEWSRRAEKLSSFVKTEGWLWSDTVPGVLQAGNLLSWMKSPSPESLIRYYRYWDIQNIFDAIARKPQTRSSFFLKIRELVEKRNNIAHGEFSAQATPSDIKRYSATVIGFCRRADRILGKRISVIAGKNKPW